MVKGPIDPAQGGRGEAEEKFGNMKYMYACGIRSGELGATLRPQLSSGLSPCFLNLMSATFLQQFFEALLMITDMDL